MIKLKQRVEIYKSPYITLYEDEITNLKVPDSPQEGIYNVVSRKSCSSIVPISESGKTIIIKQFRYPTNTIEWEFPCGGIDQNESSEDAAIREFHEEIGIKIQAERLQFVGEYFSVAGLTDHKSYIYIAKITDKEIYEAENRFNESSKSNHTYTDEIIELKVINFDDFGKMILNNEIRDSFSMVSWFWSRESIK